VIQKQQEAILKSQSSEPHVTQALKAPKVVDAIKAAGLKPGTDAYREFTTEFTTAIKQYAEGGHRKVEDPEVLGRIANDMVFTKYAYHLYDPRTWHQTQMRDNIFAVNKGIKEQFQQIWKQEHGDFPTDAQLNTMAPEAYKTYFKLLGAASRPATGKNTTQAPSSTRPAP
jgi:hypothetical protein